MERAPFSVRTTTIFSPDLLEISCDFSMKFFRIPPELLQKCIWDGSIQIAPSYTIALGYLMELDEKFWKSIWLIACENNPDILSNYFRNFYGNYSTFFLNLSSNPPGVLSDVLPEDLHGTLPNVFFFHKEFYLILLEEFLLPENFWESLWNSSRNFTKSSIWDFCRILFWDFRKKFLLEYINDLQRLLLDSLQSRLWFL